MSGLNVKIIHRIQGRLRLRLSRPPAQVDVFLSKIIKHDGIESLSFNPVSKSLLAHYQPSVVSSTEILLRVSIALSVDFGNQVVRIDTHHDSRNLVYLDYYSGASILLAGLSHIVKVSDNTLKWINYNAGYSTAASVLYHAWMEVRKEGLYDPEVVSVVYLINSLIKGNFLTASAITWIATFGRHLLVPLQESCLIKAYEVMSDDEKSYMDVEVTPIIENSSQTHPIRLLVYSIAKMAGFGTVNQGYSLIDQIKHVSKAHHNVLEGIGKKPSPVYMRIEN